MGLNAKYSRLGSEGPCALPFNDMVGGLFPMVAIWPGLICFRSRVMNCATVVGRIDIGNLVWVLGLGIEIYVVVVADVIVSLNDVCQG